MRLTRRWELSAPRPNMVEWHATAPDTASTTKLAGFRMGSTIRFEYRMSRTNRSKSHFLGSTEDNGRWGTTTDGDLSLSWSPCVVLHREVAG